MLKIKKGIQPPLVILVAVVGNVSERRGITITLTSAADGRHSKWSGHYQLRCLDIRSKTLTNKQGIVDDIRSDLEWHFPSDRIYVAIHDIGKRNEHIHVQFK